MSVAALPPARPGGHRAFGPGLRDTGLRDTGLWGGAFVVVLALHLGAGAWLLARSPDTGPTLAPEPIAMIDLPPAPVLPDAISATDLPPSPAVAVPIDEAREIGGSLVADLAPEAPEPVDAPVETAERLPPEAAEPPPVPTLRPPDAAVAERVPPDAAPPLAAPEAPPVEPPAEAAPDTVPEATPMDAVPTAAEPPIEAAPILPDAAVALSGPVALPPVKPAPPPPVQPAARETRAKTAERPEPTARKAAPRTAEKPAARAPAGPAADTAKAGGRQQQAAAAPRAAGGGAAADALKQYQAKVRADIEREVRRMPHSGRGRAVVRLSFNRNGTLTDVGIATTSGNPAIDRTILQAVKRASPFPAAPADLAQASFRWTLGLRVNN